MDAPSRKIEIFAPFSAALDLTKLILFQPFDFAKWCVIGFAAFLAHLAGGFNFRYSRRLPANGDWHWNFRSFSDDVTQSASAIPSWVVPLIVIGGLLLLAVVLVLLWIGSRGRFIFTDCIVRNRGAIVEPWREFRKEANSLFVFSLLVGLAMLTLLALAGIPVWVPLIFHRDSVGGAGFIAGVIVFGVVTVSAAVGWGVVSAFMVPVMYRRRCNALEGFRGALALVLAEPGPVILYVLFTIVLWVAFAMFGCVATCLTCCIVAIPYVGTVLLLPAYVFFMSFLLQFVRQFGPDYDVWANVPTVEAAAPAAQLPPPEPPPLQS